MWKSSATEQVNVTNIYLGINDYYHSTSGYSDPYVTINGWAGYSIAFQPNWISSESSSIFMKRDVAILKGVPSNGRSTDNILTTTMNSNYFDITSAASSFPSGRFKISMKGVTNTDLVNI